MGSPLDRLRGAHLGTGRLEWIGRARERRAPVEVVDAAELEVGTGLAGEHHARTGRGKRQVSLVQAEHLPVVAALAGLDEVDPALLRRNLVVSGVNLLALKGVRFRLGDAVLEGTGPCPPCSRMDETLGPGGFQAMRGHGGVVAAVVEAGTIRVGDALVPLGLVED